MEQESERKDEVIQELEVEVKECSYMLLNLEKLELPFWVTPNYRVDNKTEIKFIHLRSEEDAICKRTKEPCSLCDSMSFSSTRYSFPRTKQSLLNRCPSSENSVKKYKLKGREKEGTVFFKVFKIEKIEE